MAGGKATQEYRKIHGKKVGKCSLQKKKVVASPIMNGVIGR